MFRSTIAGLLVAVATLVLVCGSATARPKGKPIPPTPGVKWDYTVYDEGDKLVEKGTFVVRGYAIYNGRGKRIGTYEDVTEGQVKVEMTDGRIKGKLDLRKEKAATSWKGELARENGGTYKISVVFEKIKK